MQVSGVFSIIGFWLVCMAWLLEKRKTISRRVYYLMAISGCVMIATHYGYEVLVGSRTGPRFVFQSVMLTVFLVLVVWLVLQLQSLLRGDE